MRVAQCMAIVTCFLWATTQVSAGPPSSEAVQTRSGANAAVGTVDAEAAASNTTLTISSRGTRLSGTWTRDAVATALSLTASITDENADGKGSLFSFSDGFPNAFGAEVALNVYPSLRRFYGNASLPEDLLEETCELTRLEHPEVNLNCDDGFNAGALEDLDRDAYRTFMATLREEGYLTRPIVLSLKLGVESAAFTYRPDAAAESQGYHRLLPRASVAFGGHVAAEQFLGLSVSFQQEVEPPDSVVICPSASGDEDAEPVTCSGQVPLGDPAPTERINVVPSWRVWLSRRVGLRMATDLQIDNSGGSFQLHHADASVGLYYASEGGFRMLLAPAVRFPTAGADESDKVELVGGITLGQTFGLRDF